MTAPVPDADQAGPQEGTGKDLIWILRLVTVPSGPDRPHATKATCHQVVTLPEPMRDSMATAAAYRRSCLAQRCTSPAFALAASQALLVEARIRLYEDRQRRFAGPRWFHGPGIGGDMDRTGGFAGWPTKARQTASTYMLLGSLARATLIWTHATAVRKS